MIKATNSITGKITPSLKLEGKVNASIIREYPELEDIEITPTLEDQEFKSKKYGFDKVNVKGVGSYIDEDIKPEYIKDGVDILGVVGSFKGIDTTDATATEADLLMGKTAYVNNKKIEGTIQDFTDNSVTIQDKSTIVLDTGNKRCKDDITINVQTEELEIVPSAEGYTKEGLFNKFTVLGDADLIPENIKKGVNIFGVDGGFDAVDTRDATVTVSDVVEGKTVYVNNQKVEGTIPNNGPLEYSPSDEAQPIPSGLTSGGTVKAADITTLSEYNACLTLAKSVGSLEVYEGTTATAEDIVKGKTAYSNGELIEGLLEENTSNGTLVTSVAGGSGDTQAKTWIKKLPPNLTIYGTNASNCFAGLTKLLEFPKGVNTSKVNDMSYMFYNCYNLTTVYPFSMANVTSPMGGSNNRDMFYNCSKLSDESLNNIMESCITGTRIQSSHKKLSYMGISGNLLERCKTLPNYQAFLNAGWTL